MSLRIIIDIDDAATLPLRKAVAAVENKALMHSAIAHRCRDLTARHITEIAAPTRHNTAVRLGAGYTNYLVRAGQSVIAKGDNEGATLTIPENGAIFARVGGPVNIKPIKGKWLTIPIHKGSYGKRAREFANLVPLINRKTGKGVLAKMPKYVKKADGTRRTKAEAEAYRQELKAQTVPMFALKDEVTLSGDRGLLPSDAQYFEAMKAGITETLRQENAG